MTALQALPEPWRNLLRYDREAIGAGEVWRALSGHYVHLTWGHLLLNVAGLVLGTWVFGDQKTNAQWLTATAVSTLACGAGLYLLSPQVYWCVGLSGVLHGLMVVGTVSWIERGETAGWWLAALWAAKLGWEKLYGGLPWSGAMAGGAVVTDAHLWGAAGGLAYSLGAMAWRAWGRRV